jgi:hypothetical protein
MLGDRLGKWVLYKELGRGGMGRVYLAQEELTGQRAAIKVLAAELAQEAGFLQRFLQEIEALRRLDHPHIVRFYEAGCENGIYYFAMEYVEGQGLDALLEQQGRLPWSEVLEIALQVCAALKHAHDHGIIHRDLKPANLLRTAEGTIKLTDFGVAKLFASAPLTITGGVVGTAEYLSPEQAAGKPVTRRSDLYSLGVVLYTLLVGHPPFQGQTFLDLLHKHRFARFDPPRRYLPDLPYELDEVICQLLEKEPEKRPPDAQVLRRQLLHIKEKLERKSEKTMLAAAPAETVAEGRSEALDPERLPGPATLMSQLMRAEVARRKQGTWLGRLFQHPLVLLLALGLCLGVLIWTFWPPSAAWLFEHGARLMESEDPHQWERAWQEYLLPLQERYPDHPYQKEVEEFRQRLEKARAEREHPLITEGERFYLRGEQLRQQGDWEQARQVWAALIAAFAEVPAEQVWVERARAALADLQRQQAAPQRQLSLQAALQQAAQLAAQGRRQEAERIWQALETLYQNDPQASQVRQRIAAERQRMAGK